jgi:hypothetical protein
MSLIICVGLSFGLSEASTRSVKSFPPLVTLLQFEYSTLALPFNRIFTSVFQLLCNSYDRYG